MTDTESELRAENDRLRARIAELEALTETLIAKLASASESLTRAAEKSGTAAKEKHARN